MQDYDFEHVETVLLGEDNFRSFSNNISFGMTGHKRHRLYYKHL